jgi:hypothetical protein
VSQVSLFWRLDIYCRRCSSLLKKGDANLWRSYTLANTDRRQRVCAWLGSQSTVPSKRFSSIN